MKNKGIICALTTAFLFATLGIFTKYIYNYNISSDMIFLSSSLISTISLFVILLIENKNLSFLKISRKDFLLSFFAAGLIGLFLCNICVLKSLQYIDAGVQKVITYSNPLFTIMIYMFLFHKKSEKNELISILLMILGLILIVINVDFTGELVYIGIILSIIAAFFTSVYSIITEKYTTELDNKVYWFYSFLGAAFSSLVYMLISNSSIDFTVIISNYKLVTLLFASATLNFVIPYLAYFEALNLLGAVKTGIILTLSPVTCVLLGVFILKEKIIFLQLIGILLVISASVISSKKVN